MTCQKIGQSKKWNKISLTYSKDSQILQSYMNKKQCNLNNQSIDLYEIVIFNEIFWKSKILLNKMRPKKV